MITVSKNYLGGGLYADVYEAECEHRGRVAVKIIRPDMAERAPALAQARALMRVRHPNVVATFDIQAVRDPNDGSKVDGIVMELLDGPKLTVRLEDKTKFTTTEALALGKGIVAGMSQIHAAGLAHGDFHDGNVLIVDGEAKLIDILYTTSLALMSTEPRGRRLQHDVRAVCLILRRILEHTDINDESPTGFIRSADSASSLAKVEEAFSKILSQTKTSSLDLRRQALIQQITDEGFVDSDAYADALIDEIPRSLCLPMLEYLVDSEACRTAHKNFVPKLFSKLNEREKRRFVTKLSSAISSSVPRGNWASSLRLLRYTREETWGMMPKTTVLKLERHIADDILAGRRQAYGLGFLNVGAGLLGTWSLTFWKRMSNQDAVIDNITSMLCQNWDMQNYIGEHFLGNLERMATTPERRMKLIRGLRRAYKDDANMVTQNLKKLPSDWVEEIRKKQEE